MNSPPLRFNPLPYCFDFNTRNFNTHSPILSLTASQSNETQNQLRCFLIFRCCNLTNSLSLITYHTYKKLQVLKSYPKCAIMESQKKSGKYPRSFTLSSRFPNYDITAFQYFPSGLKTLHRHPFHRLLR